MNKSKTASQYEQLIEYILNDENDKARALFHDIVVNRSRKIYENILDETDLEEAPMDPTMADEGMGMGGLEDEVEEDQIGEADDEMTMPSDDQGQDMVGDMTGDDDMGDEMGGDDMGGDDMGGDDMGDEMGGEEDLEDRVMDLEDALDELKREFDELMADEENEPEHNDGIEDPDFGDEEGGEEESGEEEAGEEESGEEEMDEAVEDDEETVEEAAEEDDEEESLEEAAEEDDEEETVEEAKEEKMEESKFRTKSVAELMREYVEKVSTPENTEGKGVGNAGKVATINAKPTVAGKNDMGGTTKNIARGSSEANPDGKSAPSAEKPKDLIGKVQNTAGGSKKLEPAKKPTLSQASGVNKTAIIDGK